MVRVEQEARPVKQTEASAKGCDLADLKLAELKKFSPKIGKDVYARLTPEGSVAARDHYGATAPRQVRAAIARARKGSRKR